MSANIHIIDVLTYLLTYSLFPFIVCDGPAGKYLTKRNTFTDFGACADGLARQGLTSPSQLAVVGRSAGGLLVGAAANMFPHLFKAGVAGVYHISQS